MIFPIILCISGVNSTTVEGSFYPSFRMYFNLLTLLVCMTLSTCRAPVFPYRNFGIRCFQLKQNGVTTRNVQMKNLSYVQELGRRVGLNNMNTNSFQQCDIKRLFDTSNMYYFTAYSTDLSVDSAYLFVGRFGNHEEGPV